MFEEKVTVIAYHRARHGREEALKQALLALCAPTRSERGCINYDLHEARENPGLLVLHENWVSKADLDTHLRSPHIDAFRQRADQLLAEPPQITLWKQVG
jgi:quinol monooxygenase YgiN